VNGADTPETANAALVTLKASHQNRIVARVERALPNVTLADLAAHNDAEKVGAWVGIGDNVWDVTCK